MKAIVSSFHKVVGAPLSDGTAGPVHLGLAEAEAQSGLWF
jgi:hypothetical protein